MIYPQRTCFISSWMNIAPRTAVLALSRKPARTSLLRLRSQQSGEALYHVRPLQRKEYGRFAAVCAECFFDANINSDTFRSRRLRVEILISQWLRSLSSRQLESYAIFAKDTGNTSTLAKQLAGGLRLDPVWYLQAKFVVS